MRTLGRSVTCRFYKSEDGYHELRAWWSKKIQSRESLPMPYHQMYLILIGKDWTKSLRLPKKFQNIGETAPYKMYWCFRSAQMLKDMGRGPLIFFEDFLSPEAYALIIDLLPDAKELEEAIMNRSQLPAYKSPVSKV